MSLINLKSQMQGEAIQGIGNVEQMEQDREIKQEQMDQASKTAKMSAVGMGAAVGTQIMPGWGTVIGAGVGYLSTLF